MTLNLSNKDLDMLHGEYGPAARMAMSIVARMAEVAGARELLDITGAHIDSTVYIGDAGLEFAERLAGLGAKVAVPTTLNVSGLDEHHWQEWAVPSEWARQSFRQMAAYQSMGTIPTWTCAPYQTEMRPSFGQQIAWGNRTRSSLPTPSSAHEPSDIPISSMSAVPLQAGPRLSVCI